MSTTNFFAPGSFLVTRAPRKLGKLDFSGTKYKGLEVTARPVPLGLLRDEASVIAELGRSLVSWNVRDDDGKPVPADADGLASRDPEFTAAVSVAYLEAVAAPLRPRPVQPSSSPRVVPPARKSGRARSQRGTGKAGDAQ